MPRFLVNSELLLLLNALHPSLGGFFEAIQTLPQTTARLKARNGQSAVSEEACLAHDGPASLIARRRAAPPGE